MMKIFVFLLVLLAAQFVFTIFISVRTGGVAGIVGVVATILVAIGFLIYVNAVRKLG